MGKNVKLIDSAEETARAVKSELQRLDLANSNKRIGKRQFFVSDSPEKSNKRIGKRQFFVSDSPEKFKKIGERFLGKKIGKVKLIDISSY
jgi:glutamate racemase